MLGVFNPVSSSINIKQIISELPVALRIGIMRSITSVLLVVINYFRMDNHIALIHMLMGTKLILKWIIIVEVSLLEKKVFLQVKKPVKNIVILIIMHLVNMIITMVY